MSATCGSLSHSNTFLRRLSLPCELERRGCYFLDSFVAMDGLGTRCWAMRYECKSLEALPLLNKAEKPPEKLFTFCPFFPPLFPHGMWTYAWRQPYFGLQVENHTQGKERRKIKEHWFLDIIIEPRPPTTKCLFTVVTNQHFPYLNQQWFSAAPSLNKS